MPWRGCCALTDRSSRWHQLPRIAVRSSQKRPRSSAMRPGRARLRRIAELDTIMWSRPDQSSLDAAGAGERGVKPALLSNAPGRLAGQLGRFPWLAPFCPASSAATRE